MAGNSYEAVRKSHGNTRGGGKAVCCLKFWLVVFVLATLALTAAVLWLVLAPGTGIQSDKTKSVGVGEDGVMSGASVQRQPGICTLPPARGPCKAIIERFFYDTTTATCKTFIYGGCSGNANNFFTLEQCLNACSPSRANIPMPIPASKDETLDPVCTLPQDVGPCFAANRRWAYDPSVGQCVEFTFGGCGGNANNFDTKEACEARCEGGRSQQKGDSIPASGAEVVDTAVCQLPLEQGNCLANFQRWGFDASQGQCVQFIYGGCGGNANNFVSKEACEQRCIANIPMPIPATNDDTLDPVCLLEKEVGPCRAAFRRWTYDLSKGRCVEFTYGGCEGNANNFETKEACEAMCGGGQSQQTGDSIPATGGEVIDTTVCQLPLEQGNCRASIQRWGFDASQGRCVRFIYGGCGGNANNFESKEACEQRCIANVPMPIPAAKAETLDPVCALSQDVGPCRAAFHRWSYDISKGQCVEFIYSGCGGNANNFETKEACEAMCGGDICKLRKRPGPCRGYNVRYYYDTKTGRCDQFMYGGCRGNANNFLTMEECEAKCGHAA